MLNYKENRWLILLIANIVGGLIYLRTYINIYIDHDTELFVDPFIQLFIAYMFYLIYEVFYREIHPWRFTILAILLGIPVTILYTTDKILDGGMMTSDSLFALQLLVGFTVISGILALWRVNPHQHHPTSINNHYRSSNWMRRTWDIIYTPKVQADIGMGTSAGAHKQADWQKKVSEIQKTGDLAADVSSLPIFSDDDLQNMLDKNLNREDIPLNAEMAHYNTMERIKHTYGEAFFHVYETTLDALIDQTINEIQEEITRPKIEEIKQYAESVISSKETGLLDLLTEESVLKTIMANRNPSLVEGHRDELLQHIREILDGDEYLLKLHQDTVNNFKNWVDIALTTIRKNHPDAINSNTLFELVHTNLIDVHGTDVIHDNEQIFFPAIRDAIKAVGDTVNIGTSEIVATRGWTEILDNSVKESINNKESISRLDLAKRVHQTIIKNKEIRDKNDVFTPELSTIEMRLNTCWRDEIKGKPGRKPDHRKADIIKIHKEMMGGNTATEPIKPKDVLSKYRSEHKKGKPPSITSVTNWIKNTNNS